MRVQTKVMHSNKRLLDLVVISDVHLGTYGCHASELNQYLKSIHPKTLVLNGDIIDFWQYSKRYWPTSHTKVFKRILQMMADGTTIYYLTGNHDETLRKFCDTSLGNLHLANKLVLELDGKKAWFFHGDVFDVTMKHSKWLAKLGAKGYDTLIVINSIVNYISKKLGKGKISLSQKIKNGVKGAVSFISDFEETAISIAKERNYEYVICGHIHQPIIKKTDNVTYLNSGDWVENLTALEWNNGKWDLYKFNELNVVKELEEIESMAPSFESLFQSIIYPS